MSDRVYCYPDSDVLKNRMGIQDMEQLRRLEKRLTMLRILELVDKPVQGNFDLKHLQSIHRYIFQRSTRCTLFEKATAAASASLSGH